jgi:streptomycin 6-kinase
VGFTEPRHGGEIAIPRSFAEWTIAQEGDAGRAWIDELPSIVESHLDRWALIADGPVLHGYVGIALPVLRADGSRAMLKVSWLNADSCWEAHALAAWEGRGAVLLLERDDPAGVMLLERLDPTRSARELDRVAVATVAGQLCRRLEAPAPPGMPRLEDVAARWAEELPRCWERLGCPFSRHLLEAAVATCHELGPGQPDRLLHGNLRIDHILRGEREPWLVIDPNGLAGELAYEMSSLLGNLCSGLAARSNPRQAVRSRLAAFVESAGVDFERTRRWAHAHLVNEALWCREHQPQVVPYVDTLVELL